jgi:hypothetical protein
MDCKAASWVDDIGALSLAVKGRLGIRELVFQVETKLSSKFWKRDTRSKKPDMMAASGSFAEVVGSSMVRWRVKGRCRWRAYALL